ncbi:response regulator transcription factor [Novosphingobium sp. M1R2S20]|uniref:Response regulator transcription factor n=1 Tax=Novosphingobium rhizovicinum TaxID=3228928 RepID=A0ABV3R7L7_9SPHN
MQRYTTISLIDTDFRRRAERIKALEGICFHVEPFESVTEFRLQGNTESLILVHDEGTEIAELLRDMQLRDYWAPILGYGRELDSLTCSQLILQGLVGYLPMPFDRHDIERLLDSCAEQLRALVELRYGAADARQKLKTLTKREAEVLEHLQSGLTNREIATSLAISPRTVEIHRANMLRKMDTKSALTAIRMSVQAKISH